VKYYGFGLCDVRRMTVKQIGAFLTQIQWIQEKMEGVNEDELPTHERVRRRLMRRKGQSG
jgi:hypothetical protein